MFSYLPLKKGVSLHLRNLNPLYPNILLESLDAIGQVILEKKSKNVKVYGWTDRQTDGHRT